jgi:hypothetical protein
VSYAWVSKNGEKEVRIVLAGKQIPRVRCSLQDRSLTANEVNCIGLKRAEIASDAPPPAQMGRFPRAPCIFRLSPASKRY